MAARSFFDEQAKAAVRAAIEQIEAQTAAEVVVTVKRSAGRYRDADLAFAAVFAWACLCGLLFSDRAFDTRWMPFDVLVAFFAAATFSAHTPTLRRVLVPRARRAENARLAACRAFHEQKVSGTSGRNGILVFVAVFERQAVVLHDLGIVPADVPGYAAAVTEIERSMARLNPECTAFVDALRALGPALAAAMPRQDDDVNELPDEVGVT